MGLVILSLYLISVVLLLNTIWSQFKKKNFTFVILLSGALLRLIFALIIESGAKYDLAWDSLKYEADAWDLTKSWISQVPLSPDRANFYSYWLAGLFFVFTKSSLLGVYFNILFSTLSGFLLLKFIKDFLPTQNLETGFWFALLFSFYPSWFIWSSLLIKEALLVLSCSIFLLSLSLIYHKQKWFSGIIFLLSSSVLTYLLRNTFLYLLIGATGLGLIWIFLSRYLSPRKVMLVTFLLTLVLIMLWPLAWPSHFQDIMNELLKQRLTFTNKGLDDYAQSSFLVRPKLDTALDLIIFQIQAVGYYFWGPFLWLVKNLRQSFSLIESIPLFVVSLIALRGFQRSIVNHPKFSLLMASLILLPSILLANVVSNIGTIFRLRTFFIILLFYFAEWGLRKKTTPLPPYTDESSGSGDDA